MCTWCNPETEPCKAKYNINGTDFSITIEGNEIVVYRYSRQFNGHADMALEFPINYCPICGMKIELEDKYEE